MIAVRYDPQLSLRAGLGAVLRPIRTWRAFAPGPRGRNLDRETFSEAMLEERVGHARARLHLTRE